MQANGTRNGALLLGAAWTLVLAAPLFPFKSSQTWPISLMTLTAAGLGWAALLVFVSRRQRLAVDREQCAMEARMNAGVATADSASRRAVDGMAQAMIGQMQGACTELQRVDELLGHAIEQLLAAFNSVSEQARAHKSEMAQAAAAAQGTPGAERLRAAAERVAADVNGAVTALQFRDVVGQKLGHVRHELAALEQTMHRIREVSAQCAQSDLASSVSGLLHQLQHARAASPVRQELMHAGDVELF